MLVPAPVQVAASVYVLAGPDEGVTLARLQLAPFVTGQLKSEVVRPHTGRVKFRVSEVAVEAEPKRTGATA